MPPFSPSTPWYQSSRFCQHHDASLCILSERVRVWGVSWHRHPSTVWLRTVRSSQSAEARTNKSTPAEAPFWILTLVLGMSLNSMTRDYSVVKSMVVQVNLICLFFFLLQQQKHVCYSALGPFFQRPNMKADSRLSLSVTVGVCVHKERIKWNHLICESTNDGRVNKEKTG